MGNEIEELWTALSRITVMTLYLHYLGHWRHDWFLALVTIDRLGGNMSVITDCFLYVALKNHTSVTIKMMNSEFSSSLHLPRV